VSWHCRACGAHHDAWKDYAFDSKNVEVATDPRQFAADYDEMLALLREFVDAEADDCAWGLGVVCLGHRTLELLARIDGL
jgi:hypothetical protein